MRLFKSYLLMLIAAFVMVGCADNFDRPPIVEPVAANADKVNTTIYDLKFKYWDDARNYIDTIGQTEAGEDIIIKGRVVSSDETGNIYKSLVIQDETAALALSINQNSLYTTYRIGQEVVINATGMYIGKYNGLQQLGYPEWYAQGNAWEATFMAPELFQEHAEMNGFPKVSEIDTLVVSLGSLPADPAGLCQWQSQLVRLDDVMFTEADGKVVFAEDDASSNRTLQDLNGNTIIVRNSNYADFRSEKLPIGTGSVVGILSYYGTAWQLLLRSAEDCIGFSTDTKGLKDNPYTMEDIAGLQETGKTGWFSGYIVGAVKPGKNAVESNDDIQWEVPTALANTIVLGATAETKDIKDCIVIALEEGSDLRDVANLKDNESVYKKNLLVKATAFKSVYGHQGLVTSGSSTDFVLDGVIVGDKFTSLNETFDAALPANWTNVKVSGDKAWYQTTFSNNGYAAMTGYKGTQPPFDSWFITPALDVKNAENKNFSFKTQVNGYGSTTTVFEVYVLSSNDPKTAKQTKLNPTIANAPASGYSSWANSGDIDLSSYGDVVYVGFRFYATQDANYATWCIDDVKFGNASSGGGSTPEVPTGAGSKDEPYSVASAKAAFVDGSQIPAWVEGYIVGGVDGKSITDNAVFSAATATNTNILISDNPNAQSVAECIPVQLPAGAVRDALNLVSNPGNLGKKVKMNGSIEKYFGVAGFKTVTEYEIEGGGSSTPDTPVTTDPVTTLSEGFDTSIPANWSNIKVSGDKAWYQTSYSNNGYAAMTGYKGTQPPFDSWLITPALNVKDAVNKVLSFRTQVNGYGNTTSVFEVYALTSNDLATATKTKLNPAIATAPASGYSSWVESGNLDLSSYGDVVYVGFRFYATQDANYATWCVDDVKFGDAATGGETPGVGGGETPGTGGETPSTPSTGVGTKDQPHSVASAKSAFVDGSQISAWVEGYIVGSVDGMTLSTNAVFGTATSTKTNLLISDNPNTTNVNECIPVQLPTGAVRDALNLVDNPTNLGKKVKMNGSIEKYFGAPGFKSVKEFEFVN